MHIHKHICTHPSIYAQMDICMNLIALQSYPLNKFEQTAPNKLTPHGYTRQEKVILTGGGLLFKHLIPGKQASFGRHPRSSPREELRDLWAVGCTP